MSDSSLIISSRSTGTVISDQLTTTAADSATHAPSATNTQTLAENQSTHANTTSAPSSTSPPLTLIASSTSPTSFHQTSSAQSAALIRLIRDSEQCLRTSQRVESSATERLRKLERACLKVAAAHRELQAQSLTCATSLAELERGCDEMQRQSVEVSHTFDARYSELQHTLDKLGQTNLAPPFCTVPPLSPNSSRSDLQQQVQQLDQAPPQTLFDFVDGESVRVLHANYLRGMESLYHIQENVRNGILQRAQLQMQEVRKMQEEIQERVGHVAAAKEGGPSATADLTSTSAPPSAPGSAANSTANIAAASSVAGGGGVDGGAISSIVEGSPVLAAAHASFAALQNEVGEMNKIWSELVSRYDRVRQIHMAAVQKQQTQQQQQHSSPSLSSSLVAAGNQVTQALESMLMLQQQLQHHSQQVAHHNQQLEACSSTHANIYAQTVQLFTTLTAFGPSLKSALASFHSLQLEYRTAVSQIETTLVEMKNLQMWYVQFEIAYLALLEEVTRRHRQLAHQQAFLATVQTQLLEFHTEETHAREAFYHNYGRYLPPTLCPAIMESATLVKLIPDTLSTELPQSVYASAEEQQENIRKLEHLSLNAPVLQQQQQQQQNQQQLQDDSIHSSGESKEQLQSQPQFQSQQHDDSNRVSGVALEAYREDPSRNQQSNSPQTNATTILAPAPQSAAHSTFLQQQQLQQQQLLQQPVPNNMNLSSHLDSSTHQLMQNSSSNVSRSRAGSVLNKAVAPQGFLDDE